MIGRTGAGPPVISPEIGWVVTQLLDHTCILVDIFLDKLGANDTDEGGVCAIGHCTCTEGFACLVATKEDTFWRANSKVDETFGLHKE